MLVQLEHVQGETVLTLGPGTPVNPMIVGINNNAIRGDMPYDDVGLRQIIRLSNLTSLRYPGGTSGSLFDWKTGQYVDDNILLQYGPQSWHDMYMAAKRRIARFPSGTFSAENFSRLCKDVGVEPIWIPNPVTLSVESNIKFFEHLKAKGISCNYVEMGNECSGGAFRRRFPTGSDYVDACRPVMKRIRQLFPEAKIAVVGSGVNVMQLAESQQEAGTADSRGNTWNKLLMPDQKYFDALVLHSYGVGAKRLRPYRPDQWQSFTLAYPGVYMQAAAQLSRQEYGSIPIWLTEYNAAFHELMPGRVRKYDAAEEYFGKLADSTMQGLMISGYIIGALNDPAIWEMMHYHSIMGPPGFRMFHIINKEWCASPNIQIFSYLATLIRQAKTTYPVVVNGGQILDMTILGHDNIPVVAAAVLENTVQRTWLILNRGGKNLTVNLPWDTAYKADIRTIDGSLSDGKENNSLWVPISTINGQEQFWNAPLSIKPITIKRKDGEGGMSQILSAYSLTVVAMYISE
ncbi:MAG: hypothetical protein CMJ19_20140 [Phycisphaeraceae bacterium]|nr:hypothetical protein [Phycisphaeraceae bacterium]